MTDTHITTATPMEFDVAENLSGKALSLFNNLAASVDAEKEEQLRLLDEIHILERKIEEVNQVLCKATLSYMVRFQLKDDLEFYHGIIERKRQQIQGMAA